MAESGVSFLVRRKDYTATLKEFDRNLSVAVRLALRTPLTDKRFDDNMQHLEWMARVVKDYMKYADIVDD